MYEVFLELYGPQRSVLSPGYYARITSHFMMLRCDKIIMSDNMKREINREKKREVVPNMLLVPKSTSPQGKFLPLIDPHS